MGAALMVGMGGAVQVRAETEAATPYAAPGSAGAATRVMDPRAGSTAGMAQRQALLEAAETALARGMVPPAIIGFERAAMMLHAADTEMGLVRAWMQQGDYRRALAFAAHTAGAHRDSPAASAFYVWLLRVGGQDHFANQLLGKVVERAPGDPVVGAVQEALAQPSPLATGVLLEVPHRLAPQSVMRAEQLPPPAGARHVASGTLAGRGQVALVPASATQGAQRLWVRNGLGHMTEARVDPSAPAAVREQGLELLQLLAPLGSGPVRLAERDPFAGSPGLVASYVASPQADAAWPWLTQGFFGAFEGASGLRRMAITGAPGGQGGPVMDAAGHLAGISLRGDKGRALMVPVSLFREAVDSLGDLSPAARPANDPAPVARIGLDEAYEQALQITLQVLVLP